MNVVLPKPDSPATYSCKWKAWNQKTLVSHHDRKGRASLCHDLMAVERLDLSSYCELHAHTVDLEATYILSASRYSLLNLLRTYIGNANRWSGLSHCAIVIKSSLGEWYERFRENNNYGMLKLSRIHTSSSLLKRMRIRAKTRSTIVLSLCSAETEMRAESNEEDLDWSAAKAELRWFDAIPLKSSPKTLGRSSVVCSWILPSPPSRSSTGHQLQLDRTRTNLSPSTLYFVKDKLFEISSRLVIKFYKKKLVCFSQSRCFWKDDYISTSMLNHSWINQIMKTDFKVGSSLST